MIFLHCRTPMQIWVNSRVANLPWIFPGAPVKVNEAPRNIPGDLTALVNMWFAQQRVILAICNQSYFSKNAYSLILFNKCIQNILFRVVYVCCCWLAPEPIDQFHKSQNVPVPYPTTLHSEWSIEGHRTGAFWDLWIRSIDPVLGIDTLREIVRIKWQPKLWNVITFADPNSPYRQSLCISLKWMRFKGAHRDCVIKFLVTNQSPSLHPFVLATPYPTLQ